MSEEEIIYNCKKRIEKLKLDYAITNYDLQAIQGLLDLYEKEKQEKEKFKKALEKRITYCNELEKNLFENCSKYVISKDKIRDLIKELEKQDKEIRFSKNYLIIPVLKELLEEE